IIEGVTGIFFREPTVESLMEAVRRLDGVGFDKERIQAHARQFDASVFKKRIAEWVTESVSRLAG
ncbi:MAG: glycosyltransferase family 4 protein, partial [Ardenticatenaceae bacterium]